MTEDCVSPQGDCFNLIENWDGNGVVVRHDRPTGAWIFIAMHNDILGPASGGSRMKVYPDLAAALLDAMRLAEGMTYKWAGIGMNQGGGKAVLAIPRPLDDEEKEGLLERYGTLIASLRGSFLTGADLGTGPEAMMIVARKTRYVMGVDEKGNSTDPGPFTALGVFEGIKASVAQAFEGGDLAGRTVLVEGLGGVGTPLSRHLHGAGARLLLADLDHGKAENAARDLGAVVPLADVSVTECDVYAPCAIGATVNKDSIAKLRCRIVAGSANNQLREDADAERLLERGIVYAPDYIINAGGAMAIHLLHDGFELEEIWKRVATIGESIAAVLREAAEKGESPLLAARRRVDRVLAAG